MLENKPYLFLFYIISKYFQIITEPIFPVALNYLFNVKPRKSGIQNWWGSVSKYFESLFSV